MESARWISSIRRVGLAAERSVAVSDGDFQIFAHLVAEVRHADVGGLQGGHPEQFFDAVLDLPLVGGGRRALLEQQLLGHALIDAGFHAASARACDDGIEAHALLGSGSTTRNATTSKSLMPANSPFMAWVPPGVNRLATARSSFLPTIEATALREQLLGGAHVLAVAWSSCRSGRRPPASGRSRPMQSRFSRSSDLLGLGEGQQHRAIVADMHEIVRARADSPARSALSAASPTARRQKIDAGRDRGFAVALGGRDGEGAERQAFQLARVLLEIARQVDAEIVERQVGDRDAAARGLRGR